MSAVSPSLDRVLYDQEWAVERVTARYRALIWLGAGTVMALGAGRIGAAIFCVAAFLHAVMELFVLRHRYRRWMGLLSTVVDLTALGFSVDAAYASLPPLTPISLHFLYGGMLVGSFTILGINALRGSESVAIFGAVYAAAVYLVVIGRHRLLDGGSVVDLFLILASAAVAVAASRRLRRIVRLSTERDFLARYLPGPALASISLEPGGHEEDATVLFADIRGFTGASAKTSPAQVVSMLNEYFGEMVAEVFAHGGILDKFIGDGICAVFTSSVGGEDHARRAVLCARAMLVRLDTLNGRRRDRGEPPIAIGIGVHSGSLIAGTIGSPERLEYTHIGDTVNTASRIEGLTKQAGVPLLVSEATVTRGGGEAALSLRPLGEYPVRGKDEPVRLFAR